MTLNMLEYFIVVAEKGSFTDAAAACFVSQPALSRAIANLEKEVGCALIDRDSRKIVRLTPAGETMLTEARRIVGQIDVMLSRVRKVNEGTRAVISVGYIAFGLLRAFRRATASGMHRVKEEGMRLEPVYASAPEVKERVLSGELDCAILPHSATLDMQGCRRLEICRLEMRVMIPREHPLFGAAGVSMAQMKDSGFILFDPRDLPMTYALHISICQQAGFMPKVVGFGKKIGDVASLLHEHGALGIASEAFDYAQTEDLSLVPITGCDYRYALTLVYKEKAVNPSMAVFVDIIEQSLQEY